MVLVALPCIVPGFHVWYLGFNALGIWGSPVGLCVYIILSGLVLDCSVERVLEFLLWCHNSWPGICPCMGCFPGYASCVLWSLMDCGLLACSL